MASCKRKVSPVRRKTAMRSMWRVSLRRWVMVLIRRSDFSEVAGLVGEFRENLFSGVSLTEEALIDPLLEAFGEDKAEGEETSEYAEHADDVDVALLVRDA